MATFIEIANRLAKHFATSKDKQDSANYIIKEINGLVYTESQKPLNIEDKQTIVKYIGEFLSKQRPLQYKEGGQVVIIEAKDNSNYLDMVDYILSELNKSR